MSAGTIALTANGTAVTGTGTSFTADLKAGDFIVATVGGTAYTLGVLSVTSNTALVLSQTYQGATVSGLTWQAVPFATLNLITSGLAAQVSYAVRGFNLDKNNWQQIFSGTGNVTVTLPDGTSWTGPAWNGIATTVASKATKGVNNDITSLTGLTTALSIDQGGTGAKTKADAWAALATYGTTATTAAVGNDVRLGTINGKTGGQITSGATVVGAIQSMKTVASEVSQSSEMLFSTIFTGSTERARVGLDVGTSAAGDRVGRLYVGQDGTNKVWTFVYSSGSANAPGQWVNGSDRRFKTNIAPIENPLDKMRALRGSTWDRLDFKAKGIGFIAQEVQEVFPDSVYVNPYPTTLMDGSVLDETLSVDTSGVAAALHHEAILVLMDRVETLESSLAARDSALEEIQKRLKALDGLES